MFKQDYDQLHAKTRLALAFDFGFKKIGVAKGLTQFKSTSPLAIVKSHKNKANWQEVDSLIKTWKPDFFVVGMPVFNEKTTNNMAQAARGFTQKLFGKYGKNCYLVDESFSSLEAQSKLYFLDIKKGEFIDADAASVILESFFNSHTNIVNILDANGWRLDYEKTA